MNIINIYKITGEKAITLEAGKKLRDEILKLLETQESCVILDFKDVKQFTTMFFNASIAYLVSYLGPDRVINQLVINNLSDLGKKSYQRSYDNAEKKYYNNQELIDKIEQIINNADET